MLDKFPLSDKFQPMDSSNNLIHITDILAISLSLFYSDIIHLLAVSRSLFPNYFDLNYLITF